jgi:hypothetical protein
MTETASIRYNDLEVSGYLPSGWTLGASIESAQWNTRRRTWTLRVTDPAQVEWDLVVREQDVEKHGRIEALRRAVDQVYRTGLG